MWTCLETWRPRWGRSPGKSTGKTGMRAVLASPSRPVAGGVASPGQAGWRRIEMVYDGGPVRMLGLMLRGAIRAYQLLISPAFPRSCRYYPSCSYYAAEAVERHGPWRGSLLAARRLLRCHPWGGSGYDPVPADSVSGRPASAGPVRVKLSAERSR